MFPEPPPGHPLFDAEGQKRLQQFRELASSLHIWIKDQTHRMQVKKANNKECNAGTSNSKLYFKRNFILTMTCMMNHQLNRTN